MYIHTHNIAGMIAFECMFISLYCIHVCSMNMCAELDVKRLELIFLAGFVLYK